MASGFINFSEEKMFSCRWTGYDLILEIITRELKQIEPKKQNEELANWIQKYFPTKDEESNDDPGWAFINKREDCLTNRDIELQQLSQKQMDSFWLAANNGYNKLLALGEEYSPLNPDFLKEFLQYQSKN